MESLTTLIRLQQRELDRLRKQVSTLEGRRDSMINAVEKLQDELLKEIEAADQLGEMRGFFGDFSDHIKKRQKELALKIVNLEEQIQNLTVEVQVKFSDLKKYEIAYDNYIKEKLRRQAMREQKELDEIGLHKHLYGDAG